ncbi:NAD(P)H-binding protein [Nocardioides sp. HDW12B]|uniref:NAD(P)H-binding protein n=1 Tax=Nocardioides sp. HDW12B TaxID=2714939 RepID=UPI001409ACD7|nr:NAD(P)H-binding protein [Nocardioides sp. HDW12B]QIK68093.1 NAD(P)H-binding protein [Nocardioides sp. HDW12B]
MPTQTTPPSPKRIVVTGARGYIGSRLVPELLRQGHEVVATASSDPSGAVVPWADDVEWAVMDALDAGDVAAAVKGADAVCYLIHALDKPGFSNLDRQAADIMREAVDAAEVPRLVYLSGLVPDLPHDKLSHHLSSRLEVEEVLLRSRASVTSLRAGVVLGAGSTSFEIIRQLAATMLVQPVPSWLTSQIQPIAVADTIELLAHALDHDDPVGAVDVGGPDVLPYPELLALFAQEAGLRRLRLPVPPVPVPLVSLTAPLFCAAPSRTVSALVASLRHDMVCDPDRAWGLPGVATPAAEAMRRALSEDGSVYDAQPGDPTWTSPRLWPERFAGVTLPLPAVARAVAHNSETRTVDFLRARLKGLLG